MIYFFYFSDDIIPNDIKNGSYKEKHHWLKSNVEEIFKRLVVVEIVNWPNIINQILLIDLR